MPEDLHSGQHESSSEGEGEERSNDVTGEFRPRSPSPDDGEEVSNASIIQDLIRRRVPQVLAGYLGVTWTLFELMKWLTDQYLISPYLGRMILFGLLMLVPAVVLITYRHGRPGPDRWTRWERYGTAANVLLALSVLGMTYGEAELGSMVKTVRSTPGDTTAVEDAPSTAPRQIPKEEFRKRVALFYFNNKSGKSDLDWAQYGLPEVLETDLDQDLFVQVDAGFTEELRQKGFDEAVGVPLTLQQEVAEKTRMQYFLTGSFRPSESGVKVSAQLRETETGDVVEVRTYAGDSVLEVVDQMSVQLRKALGVPSAHLQEMEDLPAAELTTRSLEALQAYAEGVSAWKIRRNLNAAQQKLEKAVELDSTFALAQWRLFSVYQQQNQSEEAEAAISAAMDHQYKLPLRYQFQVKNSFYSWNQKPDRQLEVAEMRVRYYPEDLEAHQQLARLYVRRNRNEAALNQYQRVLDIAPNPEQYYDNIGDIRKEMGQYQKALASYRKYANHFPNDPAPLQKLGSLHQRTGNLDSAATYYERAHLLEPGNVTYLVRLGLMRTFSGEFEAALEAYRKAQEAATTLAQQAQILRAQIGHYRIRGQIEKALDIRERLISLPAASPTFTILNRSVTAYLYATIGREDKALRVLDRLEQKAQPPLDQLVLMGRVEVLRRTQNVEALQKAIPKYQSAIESFGITAYEWTVELMRGEVRRLQGEYAEAIPFYKEALSYNPNVLQKVRLHVRMARCHRKSGQMQKAQAEVEKALQKVPIHPEALREKALIHGKKNEQDKALEAVEKGLRVYSSADSAYVEARRIRSLHDRLMEG